MSRRVKAGTANVSTVIRIIDSGDGTPETGVTSVTAGLALEYRRESAVSTSITESDLSALTDAHSDGGMLHIGNGYYRLDLQDAAVADGVTGVLVHGVATGMVVIGEYIELVDYDPYDGVRLGLTALPNAVADAAGGLPISDAGGLDLDVKLANTNEVTAARMAALTDWINGGRLDLLLDAIKVPTDKMVFTVANQLDANMLAISGDTTAADNLELMYDGTGYTDATAPASRSQVDGISGGTGGSVNIAANSDNTISDTIDNAAAVDKTGGLVGIPITGHAFAAGNEVTIASTTNYNGSFDIVSQTTNEIVITASFVSETFGGSETCNSTIQTIAFVGSVSSGTFANTQVLDDVDHVFTDTSDVIDVAYRFTIGGGRSATSVLFTGNVNGNNDEILLKAYDFVGTTWDTVGVIDGSGGSINRNVEASLLQRHTGTGGDLGNVFIRLDTDTTTPSDLEVALLLVSAVSIGQTVGYQLGAVWIDTDDGISGTESFVNGVADNPCLTLANAITIGSNVGLHRFVLTPESSITFGETHTNELWTGLGWTLALGNRDIGGSHFSGADVTGTGTGSVEVHFDHCEVGTSTLIEAHLDFCDISGTITLSAAATYTFVDCSHAGSGAIIDFGSSVGNTTVHIHNYHGALTVKNMGQNGTDVLHFSSPDGKLTLDSTCIAGTVNLNGTFDLVNNGSGQTLNQGGDAITLLDAIKVPTDKMVFTIANQLDSNLLAISGSTTAANKLEEGAEALAIGTVNDASASTTSFKIALTGDTVDATNDHYNGRIITFTSGALLQQATDITSYDGATTTVTVTALTEAPANGDQFVIS